MLKRVFCDVRCRAADIALKWKYKKESLLYIVLYGTVSEAALESSPFSDEPLIQSLYYSYIPGNWVNKWELQTFFPPTDCCYYQ